MPRWSGSRWENGYIESFNRRLEDELPAWELFDTLWGCRSSRYAGGNPTIAFVRPVGWAIGRQPERPSRRDAVDSHGGGTTIGGRSPAHNVVVQGILQTAWVSPKFTIDCVL